MSSLYPYPFAGLDHETSLKPVSDKDREETAKFLKDDVWPVVKPVLHGGKVALDWLLYPAQVLWNPVALGSREFNRRYLYPLTESAGYIPQDIEDYFSYRNALRTGASEKEASELLSGVKKRHLDALSQVVFPYVEGLNDENESFGRRFWNHLQFPGTDKAGNFSSKDALTEFFAPGHFIGSVPSGIEVARHFNKQLGLKGANAVPSYILFPGLGFASDLAINKKLGFKFNALTPAGRASDVSSSASASWYREARNGHRALLQLANKPLIRGEGAYKYLSKWGRAMDAYQASRILKNGSPYFEASRRYAEHIAPMVDDISPVLKVGSYPYRWGKALAGIPPARIREIRRSSVSPSLPDSAFLDKLEASYPADGAPVYLRNVYIDPDFHNHIPVHLTEVPYLQDVYSSAFTVPTRAEKALRSLYMQSYTPKVAVNNAFNAGPQSFNANARIYSPTYWKAFFKSLANRPSAGDKASIREARNAFVQNSLSDMVSFGPVDKGIGYKIVDYVPRTLAKTSGRFERAARTATYADLIEQGWSPSRAYSEVLNTFIDYGAPTMTSRVVGRVLPFQQFYFGNLANNIRMAYANPAMMVYPRYLAQSLNNSDEAYVKDPVAYDNQYGFNAHIPGTDDKINFRSYLPQLKNSPGDLVYSGGRITLPYENFLKAIYGAFSDEVPPNDPLRLHAPAPVPYISLSSTPSSPEDLKRNQTIVDFIRSVPLSRDLYDFLVSGNSDAYNFTTGKNQPDLPSRLARYFFSVSEDTPAVSYYSRYRNLVNNLIENNAGFEFDPSVYRFRDLVEELYGRSLSPSSFTEKFVEPGDSYPEHEYVDSSYSPEDFDSYLYPLSQTLAPYKNRAYIDNSELGELLHALIFNRNARVYFDTSKIDQFAFSSLGAFASVLSDLVYNSDLRGDDAIAYLSPFLLTNRQLGNTDVPKDELDKKVLKYWPIDETDTPDYRNPFLYDGTYEDVVSHISDLAAKGLYAMEHPVRYYSPDSIGDSPSFRGKIDHIFFSPDHKHAAGFDNKFGSAFVPPAERNGQVASYALSLFQMYPELEDVTFSIMQPSASEGFSPYSFNRASYTFHNDPDTIKEIISQIQLSERLARRRAELEDQGRDLTRTTQDIINDINELMFNNPGLMPFFMLLDGDDSFYRSSNPRFVKPLYDPYENPELFFPSKNK